MFFFGGRISSFGLQKADDGALGSRDCTQHAEIHTARIIAASTICLTASNNFFLAYFRASSILLYRNGTLHFTRAPAVVDGAETVLEVRMS